MKTLHVECYSGCRADEDVRRFRLGAREVRVARTLDRWLGEDHRYFKVESGEGDVYVLRNDTLRDGDRASHQAFGAGYLSMASHPSFWRNAGI